MKNKEYGYVVYYYWCENMEYIFKAITDTEEKAKKLAKSVERELKKQGYKIFDENSWSEYDCYVGYEMVEKR